MVSPEMGRKLTGESKSGAVQSQKREDAPMGIGRDKSTQLNSAAALSEPAIHGHFPPSFHALSALSTMHYRC